MVNLTKRALDDARDQVRFLEQRLEQEFWKRDIDMKRWEASIADVERRLGNARAELDRLEELAGAAGVEGVG